MNKNLIWLHTLSQSKKFNRQPIEFFIFKDLYNFFVFPS